MMVDKDLCSGDRGGPLVAKNDKDHNGAATLVGVVIGQSCGERIAPGNHIDLGHFVKSGWLSSVLTDLQTCPPPASSNWFPGSSSYDEFSEESSEEFYEDSYEDPYEDSYEDSSEELSEESYEDSMKSPTKESYKDSY